MSALNLVLACLFCLLSCGCSRNGARVPSSPESAGLEAGFGVQLPQVAPDAHMVEACIDDYQKTQGKEIRLNRALHNERFQFLIFDLVHVYDGASVVYVVEDGTLRFRFDFHLPGAGA